MTGVDTRAVGGDEAEIRLDRWFQRHYPDLGHGQLQKLLRTGQVRVDGHRAKASQRLAAGQLVRVPPLETLLAQRAAAPPTPRVRVGPTAREAAALHAAILYRDESVIALNKPPGLAVQGGTGTDRHLDAMLDALRFDAKERPRLVHRLDRDTSGVLLLARDARTAAALATAFRERSTRKIYWAVTLGVPQPRQGRIDLALAKLPGRGGERVVAAPEDGKRAITFYDVLDTAGRAAAWVAFWPLTGRTHQIRAHAAELGTPILGDGKYAAGQAPPDGVPNPRRLHLHARRLCLPHPRGHGLIDVTAPLPPHMDEGFRFFGFLPGDAQDRFPDDAG